MANNELNFHRSRTHSTKKWGHYIRLPFVLLLIFCGPVQADTEVNAVTNLLKAGEYLTALTLLEDLKPIRPCDPNLIFLEARVYEAAGEIDHAMSLYELLIRLFPSYPEPYNNLAALYAGHGETRLAEKLLLRGLATHDSYHRLQNNLTKIYVARAAEAYRKALSIQVPSHVTVLTASELHLAGSEILLSFNSAAPQHVSRECDY